MLRCFRTFSAGTTQKVVFHLISNRIFRKLFVNGTEQLIIALRATHSESEAFRARNEVWSKNEYRGGNYEPILVPSVP